MLTSRVLVGWLVNVDLEIIPHETGSFQLAQIAQHGREDAVSPIDVRVSTHEIRRTEQTSNSCYHIQSGTFHLTEAPPDTAVITAVRSQIVRSDGPRTLLPLGVGAHSPEREPLSSSSAEDILSDITRLLAQ
jgi:hypothetical protein